MLCTSTHAMNPADTPLLLITWRRPHTLRQVIDAIRPVAPTMVFVASDGPKPDRPGEAEKVAATRSVIERQIDWPCHIERYYSDVNQGCRFGVSRAISCLSMLIKALSSRTTAFHIQISSFIVHRLWLLTKIEMMYTQ